MTRTQIEAIIFKKDGEEYTRFKIGKENSKCDSIIRIIVALGGIRTKENKTFYTYEVKGNRIDLAVLI